MASFKDFVKQQASNFVDSAANKVLGNVFGTDTGAASGFNINNMVSQLSKSGIAKTSHFEVWIFGPGGVGAEKDMAFRIDTIDIPGRSFSPVDHKFGNIGPVNKMPVGAQIYSDITASVIMSEDLREKYYFEKWQNLMMDTGVFEVGGGGSQQDVMLAEQQVGLTTTNSDYISSQFGYKYFDGYIGRVEIRQYGGDGSLRSVHTLNEAYPLSITPIGMNWASDEVAKISVTFAYKNYKAVFYNQDQPGLGSGFSFALGRDGIKLGLKLPGVGNISYAKGAGLTGSLQPLQKKIFSSIGL